MKAELCLHLDNEAVEIQEKECGCISWFEPRWDEIHERRCWDHRFGVLG